MPYPSLRSHSEPEYRNLCKAMYAGTWHVLHPGNLCTKHGSSCKTSLFFHWGKWCVQYLDHRLPQRDLSSAVCTRFYLYRPGSIINLSIKRHSQSLEVPPISYTILTYSDKLPLLHYCISWSSNQTVLLQFWSSVHGSDTDTSYTMHNLCFHEHQLLRCR